MNLTWTLRLDVEKSSVEAKLSYTQRIKAQKWNHLTEISNDQD